MHTADASHVCSSLPVPDVPVAAVLQDAEEGKSRRGPGAPFSRKGEPSK